MKIPVLTLRNKHTRELFDKQIKSYVDTIAACAAIDTEGNATLCSMFYCLCYKAFYCTDMRFDVGKPYRVSDICQGIRGVFKTEMIKYLTRMITYASGISDVETLKELVLDCLSLELLQMLTPNVVNVYACMCYQLAFVMHDDELKKICVDFIEKQSTRPTLDWEVLYLKFVERFE